MRAMGLRAKAGKKYKVTTDSGHTLPVAANLLDQDFSCDVSADSASHAKGPDQVWLSDIPYLWTGEGWLYACCVLDLFTRRIVGWSIEPHMGRERVQAALDMAYVNRRPTPGLILHSDRGGPRPAPSQYASADVRDWLTARGLRQSMSGAGHCYDNAPVESFWHSMKVEETRGQNFATRAEAKHCVFAYIVAGTTRHKCIQV
ncbi:MAG: IS3 family transposase [Burkholderiales bacterium]